jgi:hypothetical protein
MFTIEILNSLQRRQSQAHDQKTVSKPDTRQWAHNIITQ